MELCTEQIYRFKSLFLLMDPVLWVAWHSPVTVYMFLSFLQDQSGSQVSFLNSSLITVNVVSTLVWITVMLPPWIHVDVESLLVHDSCPSHHVLSVLSLRKDKRDKAAQTDHERVSFPSPPLSLRSNRSRWGSAAWWRSPSPSRWPRSWRGCAGSSTSLWSSSQRTSSSTSPWTNGLCATASSPSTLRVQRSQTYTEQGHMDKRLPPPPPPSSSVCMKQVWYVSYRGDKTVWYLNKRNALILQSSNRISCGNMFISTAMYRLIRDWWKTFISQNKPCRNVSIFILYLQIVFIFLQLYICGYNSVFIYSYFYQSLWLNGKISNLNYITFLTRIW